MACEMWGGNGREESISSKRLRHGGSEHSVPKLDLHLAVEDDGGDQQLQQSLAQTFRDEVKFPLLTPRRDGTRGSKTARKEKSSSRSHTGKDMAKDLASKAMSKHLGEFHLYSRTELATEFYTPQRATPWTRVGCKTAGV